jgi:CubicO group peptidase (beta-lactamase class C family)
MRLPFVGSYLMAVMLLVPLAPTTSYSGNIDYASFAGKVDSLLTPYVVPDEPGAAVVVTQHGEVIYRRCFGLASLEHGVPITPETVFDLASCAKQFTALSILILEREGHVNLDDDIHKYFPELSDWDAKVTIRHLLHQTSGLQEYLYLFYLYGANNREDPVCLADVLGLLKSQDQLLFAPGSKWAYCNSNYVLLGELVNRATGTSLTSWAREHIFAPLQMRSTFFQEECNAVIPHVAGCYKKMDGSYKRNVFNSEKIGDGYLFSTLDDIVLWLDNFRLHTVGGDSVIERMFEKSTLNDGSECFYGYGLGVSEHHGKLTVGHSGQNGSFVSMLIYVPVDEIGIAILANTGRIKVERMGYQILDLFYGRQEEEKVEVAAAAQEPFMSLDSFNVDGMAGAYRIDGDAGRLLVSRFESGFYCIFDGFGSDVFRPVSALRLENGHHNVSINLSGQDEATTRLMVDLKGDTMWASRIDAPALTGQQMAADYAGTYYCGALDIAYDVVMDDSNLVIRHRRYADRPIRLTDQDEFVGSIGIVRFSRDEQGLVRSFAVTDEDTGFMPLTFRRVL